MAISADAKVRMEYALNNEAAGTEITDLLDATAGTATNSKALILSNTGVIATIPSLTATVANATTASIANATLGRMQVTATAVNAAGSAIGNAANLSYGVNIVAGTDNTTGVILPVAVANAVVEVIQTVNAKQLAIYPQVNSVIAGLAANVALNTGVANTAATAGTTQNVYFRFIATNTTQWYVSK
jgi:hypothetical protein